MSNKLFIISLFIISSCAIFNLGYAIHHGNWWGDHIMIFWYCALFLPVYLVGKIISETNKKLLYTTMSVVGLVTVAWFTKQTFYLWSFDPASLAVSYVFYSSMGLFIYYYWKLSREMDRR